MKSRKVEITGVAEIFLERNSWAQHYGFTDEELDFIINYRMGKELNP